MALPNPIRPSVTVAPLPGDPPPVEGEEDGKKAKKKKLTKAERKQRKILAQIEFRKQEIRAHLRRELELSKKSAERGKEEWEDLCKEIKLVELKEDVTQWNLKTQRLMKSKDEKIVRLLEDIKMTQEMHRRNFEKHLETLDYIIESYHILVDSTKQLYESEAQHLIEDFCEECNEELRVQNFARLNCENIQHTTNLVMEQQLVQDYTIFLERQDDRVNTQIEERYNIRDSVLFKMTQLRNQLQDFVKSLQNATLDTKKYERIHWLMDKQRQFVIESEKLNDVELKLTKQYGDLQRELVLTEVEAQRKANDLRLEQAYFIEVRKGIERDIAEDHVITFEKIKSLTGENYRLIKEFQKLIKYGELLLSLAANCRKLETEAEKVTFYNPNEDPENRYNLIDIDKEADEAADEFKLEVLDLREHVDLTEKELVEQMRVMRKFWRRQALVESQNLLLRQEKEKLLAENKKYIDFIKEMSKKEDIDEMEAALTVKLLIPEPNKCP